MICITKQDVFWIFNLIRFSSQSTHESTKYRLVVVIEGWQKSTPISIDKVGQFFRTVQKDTHNKNIEPKVSSTACEFVAV